MKSIKISILSLGFFCLVATSCGVSEVNNDLTAWKNTNDSYFTNMKDSTAYTLYTIPASSGGGSYYYKITTPGVQSSISPVVGDQVVVNYWGIMVNGAVFDQTYS